MAGAVAAIVVAAAAGGDRRMEERQGRAGVGRRRGDHPNHRPHDRAGSAELHTIKPRGLVDVVRFTGTTQPVDQTIVKARVAGRLAEVLVREGDHATKGQVLARFEVAELQSKVNERRSAVEAARADARWTARDRSDKESLASRNIVSQSAADQARATAENRSSMVAVAEAQLEVAMRNLVDAQVVAPFDAVVGERIANQGESLPIDGKILTLLDTSHVEMARVIAAADVVRLRVGQAATATLEGFGDKKFERPHHSHQPDDPDRLTLDPGLCRDSRAQRGPARGPVRHRHGDRPGEGRMRWRYRRCRPPGQCR